MYPDPNFFLTDYYNIWYEFNWKILLYFFIIVSVEKTARIKHFLSSSAKESEGSSH